MQGVIKTEQILNWSDEPATTYDQAVYQKGQIFLSLSRPYFLQDVQKNLYATK